MAAAPSDTNRMRSASYTPSAAQAAVNRSANVVQLPVAPTRCRSSERPAVPAGPLDPREHEAQLDLHVGPDQRSLTIVPSAETHTSPGMRPVLARLGMGAQERLRAGRRPGLDAGALLGHPGVELAMADRRAPAARRASGRSSHRTAR